jgi:hypothetical protein
LKKALAFASAFFLAPPVGMKLPKRTGQKTEKYLVFN